MNKMRIEKKISIKKKQTGILDLKNTITEWKIFQKRSTTDPTNQGKKKKGSGNLETRYLQLSSQRNKKKKNEKQ